MNPKKYIIKIDEPIYWIQVDEDYYRSSGKTYEIIRENRRYALYDIKERIGDYKTVRHAQCVADLYNS